MKIIKPYLWVLVFLCTFMSITSTLAAPKAKLIPFWDKIELNSELTADHSKWNDLLQRYVDYNHPSGVNRFDYQNVTDADKELLNQYLSHMQSVDPREFNFPNQKAYWLNLYNALAVSIVIALKPQGTIRGINGIWTEEWVEVASQKVSLNDIHHGILRPIFSDPRIHFGLTPATLGSGDLLPIAFTGENVNALLEKNTKKFFNKTNKGYYIDGNKLVVSSILKWYKSDFGRSQEHIKAFIARYVSNKKAAQIERTTKMSYKYDWSMNELD